MHLKTSDQKSFRDQSHSTTVHICEVGLRDGFQFEEKIVSTDIKLDTIDCLVRSGIRHLQIASFVHPGKVPQMSDAEELFQRLPKTTAVHFSALILNEKGLQRALDSGVTEVEISASASDAHSRDNSGMTHKDALAAAARMIRLGKKHGIFVRAGIQCALGCLQEGDGPVRRVPDMVACCIDAGADQIAFSDTTGMGHPDLVSNLLSETSRYTGDVPVAMHFHDTRGLGLVNVHAALRAGVRIFDTAVGGMGGCPFVSGAAGNIATEDTCWMLDRLGFDTGIDISGLTVCTRRLEKLFGKQFPGRISRLPAILP